MSIDQNDKCYWIVSFNDGQRISSKKLNDKKLPWIQVIDYLKAHPTNADGSPKEITHIELVVNSRRFNSPTNSKNSNFPSSIGPSYFYVIYKSTAEFNSPNVNDYVGLTYRIGDYRHIMWVNIKHNTVYNQAINVVNPQDKYEKSIASMDEVFIKDYGG